MHEDKKMGDAGAPPLGGMTDPLEHAAPQMLLYQNSSLQVKLFGRGWGPKNFGMLGPTPLNGGVADILETCFSLSLSLCLRFIGHFPGEPGLAGVYWSKGWSRWWWQLDYWSYKSCKAPVKSSPPTNQHPVSLLVILPCKIFVILCQTIRM